MPELLLDEGKVLPLIRDAVFKYSFDKRNTRNLLVFIISYITGIDKGYIAENIRFKNTEMVKTKGEKGKYADLLINLGGYIVNIEVNSDLKTSDVLKNNLYLNKQMSLQLDKGDKFTKMFTYLQISFNNKNIKNMMGDKLITRFRLMSDDGKYVLNPYMICYQVNLAKALEMYDNLSRYDLDTQKFIKVLIMMQKDDILELREIAKGDDDLMSLVETIEDASKDKDLILAEYKELADEYGIWLDKQEAIEEAVEKATKKIAKETEDEVTLRVAKETAKNMIDKNLDIELISEVTGLSIKEIEDLK